MIDTSSTNATCLVYASEYSLTWGMRLGHVLIVQSAALSALACGLLLLYIGFNGLRNKFKPPTIGEKRTYFLRTPLDFYLLSLFFSDIILSMGCLLHIRWIMLGEVEQTGSYCVAQGLFKQLGDVGVALSSLAIAVHTFFVLFFRWRAPEGKLLPLAVIGLIWGILILITVIPSQINKNPDYHHFRPAAYWCSVGDRDQRIGLLFAFLWLTALINVLLYVPLFFCLRGNLVVDTTYVDEKDSKPRLRITWQSIQTKYAWAQDKAKRQEATVIAKQMLIFPVVYIVLITPLSAVRLYQFRHELPQGKHTPAAANEQLAYGWTAFAGVVFASSGFVNVLLYLITRPALFPSFRRFKERAEDAEDFNQNVTVLEPKNTDQVMATSSQQHRGGPLQSSTTSRPNQNAHPVPMLSEDDDDDDDYPQALSVPSTGSKGEGSRSSFGRTSSGTGNDIEKSLPYTTRP